MFGGAAWIELRAGGAPRSIASNTGVHLLTGERAVAYSRGNQWRGHRPSFECARGGASDDGICCQPGIFAHPEGCGV